MTDPDVILRLEQVSRTFPRDVSQISSSVVREMFLPRWALRRCPEDHFYALRRVNLALTQGQIVGVIGAHRSGKSVLAGIVSGQLQPTDGFVSSKGSRSLIARPGAGFRPGVSVINNLRFRVMLHGIVGDDMNAIIERVLLRCGIGRRDADKALGNLSRYVQRELGVALLLELPADILIIDDVTGAGTANARWELRALLQARIEAATSLVLSADPGFIRDFAPKSWVIHCGRLYGPFETDKAAEVYERLPIEDEALDVPDDEYDPLVPPFAARTAARRIDIYDDEGDNQYSDDVQILNSRRSLTKVCTWRVLTISVNNEEYRHSKLSLLSPPGSTLRISIELVSQIDQDLEGGRLLLQGGNSGVLRASADVNYATMSIQEGERITVSFDLLVQDWGEQFYGLAFIPKSDINDDLATQRLKILIFGGGHNTVEKTVRELKIENSHFDRNIENASFDAVSGSAERQ